MKLPKNKIYKKTTTKKWLLDASVTLERPKQCRFRCQVIMLAHCDVEQRVVRPHLAFSFPRTDIVSAKRGPVVTVCPEYQERAWLLIDSGKKKIDLGHSVRERRKREKLSWLCLTSVDRTQAAQGAWIQGLPSPSSVCSLLTLQDCQSGVKVGYQLVGGWIFTPPLIGREMEKWKNLK